MNTYRAKDGEGVYRAGSAADLVRQMHAASRSPADSDAEWVRQAAKRAEVQTGKFFRCESAEDFVEDLLEAGLMSREED